MYYVKLIKNFVIVVLIRLESVVVVSVCKLSWVIFGVWCGVIVENVFIIILIELKLVKLYNVKEIIVMVLVFRVLFVCRYGEKLR